MWRNPHDFPLSPGCPWQTWSAAGLPNIKWCEEAVCSWVVEPANAWSNLAFFALALAIAIDLAKRGVKLTDKNPLRFFPFFVVGVGLTSFLFHASYTFFFQFFDFIGMFAFCFESARIQSVRLIQQKKVPSRLLNFFGTYSFVFSATALFGALLILLHRVHIPFQFLVIVGMSTTIIFEFFIRSRSKKYLGWAILFFAAGEAFSVADLNGSFCDPRNHFVQGHAIWHYLSALGVYCFYRHFRKNLAF